MPRNRARTRPSRAVALLTAALLAVTCRWSCRRSRRRADPRSGRHGRRQPADELGCSADWQPDCPATVLPWDPATQTYRAAFDVPAGNYEYKITIGGGWDENYGAGGAAGGANLPLVTAATTRVTLDYDSQTHLVSVSFPPGSITGDQERALAGTSLREDLTREQFYFVMADRFANGRPATTPAA
jgi:hypothetical protein